MAVLLILAAWIVVGVALCGVGLFAARTLRIQVDDSITLSFWLGLSVTLGVLCAVCLVHAIDGAVLVLFLAAGAGGFALAREERQKWWQWLRSQARWIFALLLVSIWLADRARLEPQNGDSYLYHLHALAWAESYRATPGLGNLHDRLGFNNSSTLFLALLDHWPLAGRGTHVANGLPLLPLFGRGLRAVVRLARDFRSPKQSATPRDALDAILLAPAVDWALGMNLSSASPDLPVACLEAAIASELAGCIGTSFSVRLPALVLMSTALLTLKLSSLGFLAGLASTLAILARRVEAFAPLRRTIIASVGVVGAWIARGVILSGYPFYPSSFGALPVDWQVSPERAHEEWGYMLAYGRRPGIPWREVLASWDWLRPWSKQLLLEFRDVDIPVALAVVLLVIAMIFRARKAGALLLVVPPLVALAFWFATAPDVRFAGACFWLLPGAGAALLASKGLRGPTALLIPLTALSLAVWPFTTPWRHIGPAKPGFRDSAPPRTKPFVTRSGLALVTPASGSGCSAPALLCAAKPDEAIRLRDPNDVSAGFSVK